MMLTTRAASLPLAVVLALTLPVHAQVPAAPQVPATPATLPTPPVPPATIQPPAPPRPAQERGPRTSLDVQVVIVRTQGDKAISRLPYSLEVTTGMPESQLNIGTEVPVPTFTPARPAAAKPQAGGQPGAGAGQPQPAAPADPPIGLPQPIQPVSYRSVGTVISCRASNGESGQYEIVLSVDDNAVLPRDAASSNSGPDLPVFRAFRARNTIVLRDGQTRTFTAAADRVSGEMVRVEVTLHVLKN